MQVPLLRDKILCRGSHLPGKTAQERFALITKGEPACSPLKQVTGSLLSALERDAVNMCFKVKLVSNQSNC